MSKLLQQLCRMSPVASLSLKKLTLKTVALVAILLAARGQTLVALDIRNMTVTKSKICFTVGKATLKQSRPSYTPPLSELTTYPIDRRVCVYTVLGEYIKRTKPWHTSGIPYTPYTFRVRIRVRIRIMVRVRIRVRD